MTSVVYGENGCNYKKFLFRGGCFSNYGANHKPELAYKRFRNNHVDLFGISGNIGYDNEGIQMSIGGMAQYGHGKGYISDINENLMIKNRTILQYTFSISGGYAF